MVIPGHARSQHRYRGTPIAIERIMHTGQAETKKGQTRNASKDQRGSEKAIGCEIPRSIKVYPMGGHHSASTKERWQSTDVCGLSGFE